MGVQINGSEGNVIATKGTFSGDVGIGGTLTYEDVTNIDSVGLITARSGIEIGASPGVAASISVDGNMIVSGISTFGGDVQVPDKIIHSGDTNTAIRFPSADTITAETGGSERVRITSGGNVNIGGNYDETSHPLNVSDATKPSLALHTGTALRADLSATSGICSIRSYANNPFTINTGGSGETEALRIKSDGDVIIGGSSDAGYTNYADNLTIHGTSNEGITIRSGNTSGASQGAIYFADATGDVTGAYEGYLIYDHNGDHLRFGTNHQERLRITSGGQLSTSGETSPDVSAGGLCLDQNAEDTNILSFKSSDINHGRTSVDETDTWFSIRKVSGDKGGAYLHGYTDTAGGDPGIHIAGYIDSQGSSYRAIQLTGARKNTGGNTGSSPFTSGNPIVRISNDFDTTVASFTPDGLAFNDDTAAANSLGDYEEGTFTPAFGGGISASSYHNQSGHYTKIGDQVYAYIYLRANSASTGSANVTVTGLPYTCNSAAGYEGGGYFTYLNGFFGTAVDNEHFHPMPWVSLGNTYAVFHTPADGNNITGSDTVPGNKYCIFHLRYKAA